jgi:prepilin-type N-terminal cleavage/methylation domain-containing protein/prepilin-type processing-associated H-X9-DG protein
MHQPRRGFSLVELIVVVGLLAVLVGLLLPAVQSVRDAAARASCQDRQRQIGIALQNYHAAHGHFPSAGGYEPGAGIAPTADNLLNWMAHILPEIEQDDLWRASEAACRVEPRPYISPPHIGYSTPIKLYVCPADDRLTAPVTTPSNRTVALTSYIGSAGAPVGLKVAPGVFFNYKPTRVAEITDGTSQTVMVGERPPPNTFQAGQWYQGTWILERFGGPDGIMHYYETPFVLGDPCWRGVPYGYGPGRLNNPCDRLHFWSLHRGGANFLFADGSVHFLSYSARDILPALITRAGGESVSLPD